MEGARTDPFVGRQQELGDLSTLIDAHVGPVLLSGPAGSGKTRLLSELRSIHGRAVLHAQAEQRDADRPFAVISRALSIGPAPESERDEQEARPVSSGPDTRFRLWEWYLDEISRRAADGEMLIIIDDAQWADSGSLGVLESVTEVARGDTPALLLATRPVTSPPDALVRLAARAEAAGSIVDLAPLAHDEVLVIASASLGNRPGPTLERCLTRASGNPLIVHELLDAVSRAEFLRSHHGSVDLSDDDADVVTGEASSVLLARLVDVSDGAREAIRVASVIGPSFGVDEVAGVLGVPPARLITAFEELVAVGLVDSADDRLAFRHDLVREAVYGDLAPWARVALHRQVAAGLVSDGADAVAVARHLDRAEPTEETGPWFERAGRGLLHTDPRAAAALLSEAFRLSASPPDGLVLAYVQSLAWTNEAAAAESVARQHLDASVAAAGAAGPRAHFALAQSLTPQGRMVEAAESMSRAGELLVASGQIAEGHQALAEANIHRAMAFEHDEAAEGATLLLAVDGLDDTARVIAHSARSWVHKTRGDIDGAVADGRKAVELAGDNTLALRGNPHLFLADALLTGERYDEFEPFAIDARRTAARHGSVWSLPGISAMVTGMHLRRGDWDKAIAESDAGLSWARDTGNQMAMPWLLSMQAVALLWMGKGDDAEVLIAEAEGGVAGEVRTGAEAVLWARSWALELAGDVGAAAPMLELLWQLVVGLDVQARMSTIGPDVVRAAMSTGNRALASEVADRLDALDDAVRSNVPARHYCRGLVDCDEQLLRQAADGYAPIGLRVEGALALADAAAIASSAGRTDAAVDLARQASALHRELGADGLQHRLERVAGPAVCAATVVDKAVVQPEVGALDSLSPAERRVADLVTGGLNNLEIAEQLFISRRTVESHLSHVYTKLGIRSRVELAVLASA